MDEKNDTRTKIKMRRERINMDDGRYLIFYSFDGEPAAARNDGKLHPDENDADEKFVKP